MNSGKKMSSLEDLRLSRVQAVVEGETEQSFVRDILACHLVLKNVHIEPILPGKKLKHEGARKWESACRDICNVLKSGRMCTTMFDYYGLPRDWPGRQQANALAYAEKASHIETALSNCIAAELGSSFNPARFIPYVQMHEFEAILFSNTAVFCERARQLHASPLAPDLREQLEGILEEAGDPEKINDNYDTCPSRRIKGLIPRYRKPLYGTDIAEAIGLEKIRAKCPHFDAWLQKLEAL